MIADNVLHAAHTTRRLAQTPKAFSNWAEVLSDMARQRIGRGPETLTFAARNGLRINCPNVPGARVPIYEVFAEDTYQLKWFLGPLLERPIQVIDIGGHIGTFACSLAQVHSQATIQCFEPSATTAGFLRRNAAQNGFVDRITVYQRAVAAETGFAVFDDNGGASGTNGLIGAGRDVASGTATKVETVAFDEAVASTSAPIDFVKMDCEGGEYDLTFGSSRDSWASVQRLVLEYHQVEGQSWSKLRSWFEGVGLQVVKQAPITDALGTAWLSRGAI
jgi:FkbM family methyltransferase